ncbi:ABC transporter permease [Halostella sp. JP-L12]|uniref:ABC transporter permease n=1 Tax=Halostella TaxID=1843185 RepID=UPI000EF7DE14|nr:MULTISPECIES: ABC transporter permease [Halostella]NHN47311.1 ABC transporter permease [Halostella sp. JP-L12]
MSLSRFLLKRALQGLFVIWGVVTVVFGLRFISPGDPANVLLPPDVSESTRQQVVAELGLDQPLYVQYLDYIAGLLVGDMGTSLVTKTEASGRIIGKLPATLELAVAATIVAVVIAIPLGVLSATRRHEPADYGATVFSLAGISTPNFWLGIMLIIVFAVQLNLFPTSRRPVGIDDGVAHLVAFQFGLAWNDLSTWLWHVTLPAITLGTYFTALITRLTRSGMLEELGQGYVRAARAKGLPETLVRYKHALRNTLIPIITVVGLQLGTLIGGAVITEAVFNWPGLGTLIINSIQARDWPVVQGSIIVIGVGFVVLNILVDALYAYVNPQVTYD